MTDAAPQDEPMTADDVIRSIMRSTADRLLASESDAIADAPDGVHQHRTHVRRLRSVLAGFRPYLDDSAAHDLRVQFAEWGHQLGVVRDIEVRAEVAREAMEDLGLDDADLRVRLVDDEYEDYARAHTRLRELHAGPRADARKAALRAFAADPPLTSAADADAAVLTKIARAEARRVKRAAKRSDGSIGSLHAVRKAGRRLRYVAEALHDAAPEIFGDTIEELAAAGEEVHDALGDHRDELIFIERLEIARARASRAGERVDPYDALIARSRERAKKALHGLGDALDRVRKGVAHL
jgi:CHAD domain-containing protein